MSYGFSSLEATLSKNMRSALFLAWNIFGRMSALVVGSHVVAAHVTLTL